jgi:hypothetical protein
MDYLEIGPVPYDEECAQVGTDGYLSRARIECAVFLHQLERAFPNPPGCTYFRIKSNPHDFGSYLEVHVIFDEEDETSREYAFNVEGNTPVNWDEIAKKELMVARIAIETGTTPRELVQEKK